MKSIYSKKAQIGTFEMIMVLAVVVIMIAIGMFYYYKIYIEDIGQEETSLSDIERDILLVNVLALPEIRCSFNTVEQDCIDIKKLETGSIESNKAEYIQKFGFKVIKINEIYPENTREWIIYNNEKQGYKSKNVVSVPVSLYFSRDNYKVGRLTIEDYK